MGRTGREIGVPLPFRMMNDGESLLDCHSRERLCDESSAMIVPSLMFGRRHLVFGAVWKAIADEHYEIAFCAKVILHTAQCVAREASWAVLGVKLEKLRQPGD